MVLSQWGVMFPPGDLRKCLETLLVVTSGGVLLTFSRQRPGMLLNIVQWLAKSPTKITWPKIVSSLRNAGLGKLSIREESGICQHPLKPVKRNSFRSTGWHKLSNSSVGSFTFGRRVGKLTQHETLFHHHLYLGLERSDFLEEISYLFWALNSQLPGKVE